MLKVAQHPTAFPNAQFVHYCRSGTTWFILFNGFNVFALSVDRISLLEASGLSLKGPTQPRSTHAVVAAYFFLIRPLVRTVWIVQTVLDWHPPRSCSTFNEICFPFISLRKRGHDMFTSSQQLFPPRLPRAEFNLIEFDLLNHKALQEGETDLSVGKDCWSLFMYLHVK